MVVKGNQPTLYARLEAAFATGASDGTHSTHDHGHGRDEIRRIDCVSVDPADPTVVDFRYVRQIVRVIRDRTVLSTGSTSQETSYAIISRDAQHASPADVAQACRLHWTIENHVHWRRDTRFAEDANRTRVRHSPVNLACLRNWTITAIGGLSNASDRFADHCRALKYNVGLAMTLVGLGG